MPAAAPPRGIYVPAVLFFTKDDLLDYGAIKAHVLRLAQGGVTGILVQGSNGEAQHLSHDERKDAISFTRKALNDNGFKHVLVIAGTGAQSTRETINLCCDAKEAGATHALVLTPSTWVPAMTREAIVRFHITVADNSPIPTMIYNFPTVTAGQNLTSDVIGELARHPNIVGTKLSCGDVGKLTRLSTVYGKDTPGAKQYGEFATLPGKSDVLLPGLLMKSHGLIGALVNLAPKAHVKVVELFDKGDLAEAIKIQQILSQADAAASAIGGIGGLKACCAEYFGYGEGNVRGPLTNASRDKVVQGAAADLVDFDSTRSRMEDFFLKGDIKGVPHTPLSSYHLYAQPTIMLISAFNPLFPFAILILQSFLSIFPEAEHVIVSNTLFPLAHAVLDDLDKFYAARHSLVKPAFKLAVVEYPAHLLDGRCPSISATVESTCSADSASSLPGLLTPDRPSFDHLLEGTCLTHHATSAPRCTLSPASLIPDLLKCIPTKRKTLSVGIALQIKTFITAQVIALSHWLRHLTKTQLRVSSAVIIAAIIALLILKSSFRKFEELTYQLNLVERDNQAFRHANAYLERSLHQMAVKRGSFDASQTATDALRAEKKRLQQALNDAQETIERQAEQLQDLKQLLRATSEANTELQEHKVRTEAELSQLKCIKYRLQEEAEKEQIESGALQIKIAGITMENEHLVERVRSSEEKLESTRQDLNLVKVENEKLRNSVDNLKEIETLYNWNLRTLSESEANYQGVLEKLFELKKDHDSETCKPIVPSSSAVNVVATRAVQSARLARIEQNLGTSQQTRQPSNQSSSRVVQELKVLVEDRLTTSITDSEQLEVATNRLRSIKNRLSKRSNPPLSTQDDSDSDETIRGDLADSPSETKQKITSLEELLLGQQRDFDAQIELLLEDRLGLEEKLSNRDGEIKRLLAELEVAEGKRKVHDVLEETW